MLPALLRFRLVSLMLCLLTGLVLAAARYSIFGDILPNTTFAKLGLENFGKGWLYLAEFVLSYPEALTVLFLLLLLSVWTIHQGTGSGAERGYFRHHASLAAATALVLVTVRLGGDFMHGRFFLPAFVLLVLGVSEWVRIAHRNAGRSRRRLIALLAAVLPFAGIAGMSYSLRTHQAGTELGYINDEQLVYSVHNPNQGTWDATNLNRWAHEARVLSDLADLIDGGIGIAQTGVGHIRYFSAESDVYIYDALSLAQHLGTLVDQRGRGGRPGHRAGQPVHFLYANPRITLFRPPDAPLADLLDFRFLGMDFVLGDLERIPRLASAGLLPEGTANKVEDRVRAILDDPRTDTQALLYLWYRYRGDPATRARIESRYIRMSEIAYTFPWEHRRNLRFFTAADSITQAEAAAIPDRYTIMLREGDAKPLKRRHAYRRHVDRAVPSCEMPVSAWTVSGSAASMDAGDPRRLELDDAGKTEISLPMSTIAALCPQSVKQVQVLVQPIEVSGQPIARFLASGQREPIPVYGVGRHGYQPPLVYPLRTSDGTWAQAVTISIPVPEGARAEFEIVAIAS